MHQLLVELNESVNCCMLKKSQLTLYYTLSLFILLFPPTALSLHPLSGLCCYLVGWGFFRIIPSSFPPLPYKASLCREYYVVCARVRKNIVLVSRRQAECIVWDMMSQTTFSSGGWNKMIIIIWSTHSFYYDILLRKYTVHYSYEYLILIRHHRGVY